MVSKKILVPFMTIALVGGTFLIVPQAHAQETNPSTHANFFDGLVQFLEQKFGLDKTQVNDAVKEYKAQAKANITPRPTMSAQVMEDREKTRLDKLVSTGKITTAQEQAIIDELKSLHTKYPMDANQTKDQRKTSMENMQKDLKAWATAQGIDKSYLMPMGGRGGFGGPGMRGKMEHWDNRTVTPTP